MIDFNEKEKEILEELEIKPAHLQYDAPDKEYNDAYDKLQNFCMNNFKNHIPNEKAIICEGIFDKLAEE